MSLFIPALAFGESTLLDQAKLGVLTASALAASLGLLLMSRGRQAPAVRDSLMA